MENLKTSSEELEATLQKIFSSPYLISIPDPDIEIAFIAILKRISELSGKTLTEDQIRLYCREIARDVRLKFSWIKTEEFRYALELGAKGYYGTVYDISYQTIINWIIYYRNSSERQEFALKMANRKMIDRSLSGAVKSNEELERSRNEHLREMSIIAWDIFNHNMKGNFIPDARLFMLLPEEAYFYLEKAGHIVLSKDEKTGLLAHVESLIKTMRKVDERIGDISGSLFSVPSESESEFLKTCARKFATARYFNQLNIKKQKYQP